MLLSTVLTAIDNLLHLLAKITGNYLVSPSIWITFFLVTGLLAKKGKIKNRLLLLSAIFYLFFTNHFIENLLIGNFQSPPVSLSDSAGYSCGILLNGFIVNSGNNNTYFNEAGDRFTQCVELYHRKVIRKIFTVGNNIEAGRFREADYIKDQLIKSGVKPEDILTDNTSGNTYEGALVCKKTLGSFKPPFVLITSAYHMPRAKMIFDREKINTIAYPCNYMGLNDKFTVRSLIIPNPEDLFKWQIFLREMVGIVYYKFR